MHRTLHRLIAAVAVVTAACSDNQLAPDRAGAPAIESLQPRFSLVAPPDVCPTVEESQKTVDTLLPQIFGPGQGRRGTAQGYSNNIVQARRNGDTEIEKSYVETLINYTLQNYFDGNLIGQDDEATQIRVLNFFYALYCASKIEPIPDLSGIFGSENTQLIRFNTPTTIVTAGPAAVQIEQGEVPSTIFGTYVSVYRSPVALPTSLDWYGIDGYRLGAWEFTADPEVTFTTGVLVGVCFEYDEDVVTSAADLRLAHAVEEGYEPDIAGNHVVTTAGGTIEIAAFADPSGLGLDCLSVASSGSPSVFGRMLQQFASLVVPTPLYAATGSSTGGTVRKFSPFAAVDTKLTGTATGPSSPVYIPINSTTTTAPESVTVTTRNDATPIDGIGVTLAPAGSFWPTLDTTSAAGTVGSTWTIVAGSNTGTATVTSPAVLAFSPAVSFSVTGVQLTTLMIDTDSPLPDAVAGAAYSQTLAASGGAGAGYPYTWSLETGSNLPAGLSLSSTGVISGTPTTVGTSSFVVTVTSGGLTSSKSFTLTVGNPTTVTLTFDPQPLKRGCYAVDAPMDPGIRVKVTAGPGGPLLSGVTVDLVAVTNNGAKVSVTPSSVVSVGGYANFGGPTINKTGGYALIASTASPVAQVTSTKFTISPSCS